MAVLNVRNVPDALMRTLKSRAAENGVTLREYVLMQLGGDASEGRTDKSTARLRAEGGGRIRQENTPRVDSVSAGGQDSLGKVSLPTSKPIWKGKEGKVI